MACEVLNLLLTFSSTIIIIRMYKFLLLVKYLIVIITIKIFIVTFIILDFINELCCLCRGILCKKITTLMELKRITKEYFGKKNGTKLF